MKGLLKKELKPDYKYDSAKTTRFYYKTKKQVKVLEIPLYRGEKYKFLFNTEGLTKDIGIQIYTKPLDNKKTEMLFELKPTADKTIYEFEPEKSRKMYLVYKIPAVENPTQQKDCMVMVLGYALKINL